MRQSHHREALFYHSIINFVFEILSCRVVLTVSRIPHVVRPMEIDSVFPFAGLRMFTGQFLDLGCPGSIISLLFIISVLGVARKTLQISFVEFPRRAQLELNKLFIFYQLSCLASRRGSAIRLPGTCKNEADRGHSFLY